MLSENNNRTLRWGVSLLVAGILLAQAVTLPLKLSGHSPHTWYWPIVDYPMYEFAHQEGEYVISERTLEVELLDGTVEQISGKQLGLNFWNFLYFTGRLQRGETASVQLLVETYDRGGELSRLRVYSPPIILTREGARKTEPKLLGELTIDDAMRGSAKK